MIKILVGLLILLYFLSSPMVFSHPGGKASDGCHYCRTNCSKWGEVSNARHCHGISTSSYTAPVKTTPSCPLNAYYSSSSRGCKCSSGYTKHYRENRCVSIPNNAYATPYSTTNSWLCDYGYEEKGNSCVEIQLESIEDTIPDYIAEEKEAIQKINDRENEINSLPVNTTATLSSTTSSGPNDSGAGIFTTLFWIFAGGFGYKAYRDRIEKL